MTFQWREVCIPATAGGEPKENVTDSGINNSRGQHGTRRQDLRWQESWTISNPARTLLYHLSKPSDGNGTICIPGGFWWPLPRSGASIQSRCMPGLAGVGAPSHSWQTVHHCVSFPFFPLLLSDLQEEKLWGWPRCQLVWHSWGFLKTCIFYTAGHWHGWYRSICNPLIKQQWSLFHGQSIFIVLITRDYFKCVADKCPL